MYIGLGLPITAIRGAAGFGGAISTATVGQTVYAVLPITGPGNPPGAPNATPTLRWQRNGTNIPGATGVAYVVQAADIGAGTLSVVGTGTAGEAISIPAISVQAVPVVPVAPANTVAPTISGTAQEGQTLTVARGTWTGTATITYAYQWQRGGVNIHGATATTYAAVFDDVGTTLRVVVTASNAGGVVSANSAATAVVSAAGGGPALNRNVKVIFIGDSTTAGVGADPTGLSDINGARPFSAPLKAKDWLAANGVPAIAESIAGNNNVVTASWPLYRTDIALSASTSVSSRTPTAGGTLQRFSTTQSIQFTPSVSVDTVEFAFVRASGFGVLELKVDGVSVDTFNQSQATEDYFLATVTGLSNAPHTFEFTAFSGLAHGPGYINAWSSAQKTVQIINAGARNWTTTDWNNATYPSSPRNALGIINPDITVIDLGINDYRQPDTTIEQCTTRLQNLITDAIGRGSQVILVVPNPILPYNTTADAWSQSAVLTMYQALATSNPTAILVNAPEVYFNAGLGTENPATRVSLGAAGLMYDSFHPKAEVYEAEGNAIGEAIKSICVAQGWLA